MNSNSEVLLRYRGEKNLPNLTAVLQILIRIHDNKMKPMAVLFNVGLMFSDFVPGAHLEKMHSDHRNRNLTPAKLCTLFAFTWQDVQSKQVHALASDSGL